MTVAPRGGTEWRVVPKVGALFTQDDSWGMGSNIAQDSPGLLTAPSNEKWFQPGEQ